MEGFQRRSQNEPPSYWWGPVWHKPKPRSIVELIRGAVLNARTAGLLWALLSRRVSFAVVAGPSGAGKTTLASALLEFCPRGQRRVYVRGLYEPFDFLTDPEVVPERSVILVNEVSPHLPIYLWGPGVRTVLRAGLDGFQLVATAHATSAEELVGSLAGYPLRVPAAELAALRIVVILDAQRAGQAVRRRVRAVVALEATARGGIRLHQLVDDADVVEPAALMEALSGLGLTVEAGIGRREVERRATVLEEVVASSTVWDAGSGEIARELADRYGSKAEPGT